MLTSPCMIRTRRPQDALAQYAGSSDRRASPGDELMLPVVIASFWLVSIGRWVVKHCG
jgi:hypothetical protein